MAAPDAEYQPTDIQASRPTDTSTTQDEYKSRPGQTTIPVVSDSTPAENNIDPKAADSDAQLARDDADAIDQSNVVSERTRGAVPKDGYKEPGDEEGLPVDDGTSSGAST